MSEYSPIIFTISINLLVVYRESVNLSGYITRRLSAVIIHQIFSLARDWTKRVTWANIPQLKLGNIRGYSPLGYSAIFKTDG